MLPGGLLHHSREETMHGGIVGQFGMKGGHDDRALPSHHDLVTVPGQRGDAGADPADARSSNEDHLDGPRAFPEVGLPFRLEAFLLTAVGVAHGRDVDHPQRGLLRALPAGHDETSNLVELPGQPHLDRLDTEPVEGLAMEVEVTLQGEHADAHGWAPEAAPYQPRVWSRSDSLSLEVSIPCMASPRSSETLARMSASL